MKKYLKKITAATNFLQMQMNFMPETAIVLGSGLGALTEAMTDVQRISFADVPHFPVSTVAGHESELIIGRLDYVPLLVMRGRAHYYEGYSMKKITFPIRIMKQLGIQNLFLTNACGGINTNFKTGDLVLINDHINLLPDNPLIGKNSKMLGPRFPDMAAAYDKTLRQIAKKTAENLEILHQMGVYAAVSGPCYETPAEVQLLRTLGADVVGMSTVPEVIVAIHSGMKVLCISCVTDMPASNPEEMLTHEEVVATAAKAAPKLVKWLKEIVAATPLQAELFE